MVALRLSAHHIHDISRVATSEDVPGLVAEAATSDELQEKLLILTPELLELNAAGDVLGEAVPTEVPLYVMHERASKIRLHV